MNFLSRINSDYESERLKIDVRRASVWEAAHSHIPVGVERWTDVHEELGWGLVHVKIADPTDTRRFRKRQVNVSATLGLWAGNSAAGVEPGLKCIDLDARYPDSPILEYRILGRMSLDGSLTINYDPENINWGTQTSWESGDAELFLQLAESYFAKVPHE